MYIYLGIFWKRTKSFFEHEFSDVSFILSLLQKKKKIQRGLSMIFSSSEINTTP